jgi:hypothetical protein
VSGIIKSNHSIQNPSISHARPLQVTIFSNSVSICHHVSLNDTLPQWTMNWEPRSESQSAHKYVRTVIACAGPLTVALEFVGPLSSCGCDYWFCLNIQWYTVGRSWMVDTSGWNKGRDGSGPFQFQDLRTEIEERSIPLEAGDHHLEI